MISCSNVPCSVANARDYTEAYYVAVDDIQDTQVELNNTITGKSALLEKPSSWVYEPLEMDLEDISGGGDTEEDSGYSL